MNSCDISAKDYSTAATGAFVGGAGAFGAMHKHLSGLADKTVKAFKGTKEECDSFVSTHKDLVKKAVHSKKGFFGKISKSLRGNTSDFEGVKNASDNVLGTYAEKAAKKVSRDNAQNGAKSIKDKLLSEDILKSFKDSNKGKTALIAVAAALIGAVGACVVKEVLSNKDTPLPRAVPSNKVNLKK